MSKRCTECGQPMLPCGAKKLPNEYDHASGFPKVVQELFNSGWSKVSSTVWVSPSGQCFRGPYLAWRVMKGEL